ncbi:MAG TPA: hypothetical protein VMP67_02730 [Candidatus Limnocylindria bacterium]|nr:hypothetical protein [Candidatus Limnocylindria bacterium]
MNEAPRPQDLGEQRTPVGPEPEDDTATADPRSEPGAKGAAARLPYWLVVGAVLLFAIIALYFAGIMFPAR